MRALAPRYGCRNLSVVTIWRAVSFDHMALEQILARQCKLEVAGDAALLVDPLNTEALAAAKASLIGDSAFAGPIAAAGTERAGRFTWERCASQTVEFLRSLL